MKIVLNNRAKRAFRRLPKDKQAEVDKRLEEISKNPFARDNNRKPLSGVPNGYRRRFGQLRVSYIVDRENDILEVFEIAWRGEAYR